MRGVGWGGERAFQPLVLLLLPGWPGQRPSDATDDSWWETRTSPTGELLEEEGLKKQRQIHFCKKTTNWAKAWKSTCSRRAAWSTAPVRGAAPSPSSAGLAEHEAGGAPGGPLELGCCAGVPSGQDGGEGSPSWL